MLDALAHSWIVASTHPHKENVALDNLKRQGFRVYCPKVRKRIRHARRLQQVIRPLFPGYIFIRLNPEREQWRSIGSTFGVRNLIRFGDRPGTIPDQFIERLHATEQEGVVSMPSARDSYSPGEKVRLREGPFEGLIATVLAASECNRVVVLMDLLRRSVRVRLAINEVVPA
jgi:transcriptional antiterminator RfaH